MFAGFIALGATLNGIFNTKNTSESPTASDSLAIFKIYGPDGLMQNGTGIASKLGDDTGVYQYAITADPSNGYEVGVSYRVFITATILGTTVAYEQSFIVS